MGKVARDRTLQNIVEELVLYNNFLIEFYGKLKNLNTTDKSSIINAINEALNNYKREPVLELKYNRNGSDEYIECTYKGNGVLSASSSDTSIVDVELSNNNIINITRHKSGTPTITVNVSETDTHFSDTVSIIISKPLRFGYRIKESESDPYVRVEYLYDAEGMTPAKMLSSGFDYGDWENIWFVKNNKPLMLNSDGTVAYYLNPNNYALKEDGTSSDVSNTSFDGNAMAQMPLVWIKRYSENGYHYEIVSDTQYDSDYKAYAHTRANGTIAPYFYYSMFNGSGSSSKLRSISGQSLLGGLTMAQYITSATANGSKWHIHSWSQREYIRTLLTLIGKSTNSQAIYGNGNCSGALLSTGTLNDKGQFYGSLTANNIQVKCFYIEGLWANQQDVITGLIQNSTYYVKMTPEGSGYQTNNTTGYYNTGLTTTGTDGGYVKECSCSQYGIIPIKLDGSATTYYCDQGYYGDSGLCVGSIGRSCNWSSECGIYGFDPNQPDRIANTLGVGLSCEMPTT